MQNAGVLSIASSAITREVKTAATVPQHPTVQTARFTRYWVIGQRQAKNSSVMTCEVSEKCCVKRMQEVHS